ncbi:MULTISPECIES: hypothetical protein [Thermomonosporaceae]|uniref:hypothetical protein n=1 Tax=Thermomonosporaceae TaxID=2012 RepID=UPI00255A91E4|nr:MULTISPECIES: hypothetical protein [Thermomonosporaceae]MDL4774126.1 hypothetical protein [Actinomadura xylanilytica]
MSEGMGRRELIGKGGALVPAAGAAALLAAALTPEPASADTPARAGIPLPGTWAITVTITDLPGVPPEPGLFAFGRDGLLTGTGGASKVVGFGTWKATGATTFAVDYRHFVISDDGVVTGTVRVEQTGRLASPDRLTMTGKAAQVDNDGNVVVTLTATSAGERYGFGPAGLGG